MKVLLMNGSPNAHGATARILEIITNTLKEEHQVESICLGNMEIKYCKGCRSCHTTARCIQKDDVNKILDEMNQSDRIIIVAPSYWADIPGQLKVFIDRCTPYCNTHDPHARLSPGKKGYAVALRTGLSPRECEHIIDSINHFYGHMEIEAAGSSYFCGINDREDIAAYEPELMEICKSWFN